MIINLNYGEVGKILEEYYKDKFDKRYNVNVYCGVEKIVYPDRLGMDDGYTKYIPYSVIKLSAEIELFGEKKLFIEEKKISENEMLGVLEMMLNEYQLNVNEIKAYTSVKVRCLIKNYSR